MNRPLCASKEAEASARGASLLALEALGIIRDVSDVPSQRGEVLLPDEARSAKYRRALERQNALYAKLYE